MINVIINYYRCVRVQFYLTRVTRYTASFAFTDLKRKFMRFKSSCWYQRIQIDSITELHSVSTKPFFSFSVLCTYPIHNEFWNECKRFAFTSTKENKKFWNWATVGFFFKTVFGLFVRTVKSQCSLHTLSSISVDEKTEKLGIKS